MEITKEYLTQKNTVFHCETEKEANQLLKIANEFGLEWANGDSYLNENEWEGYKELTCYNFNKNKTASIFYYKSNGFNIIKAKDILHNNDYVISFKSGEELRVSSNSLDLREFSNYLNDYSEDSFLFLRADEVLVNIKEVNYIRKNK